MVMQPIARKWSVQDVWALPNDPHHRYETADGTLLVSPSPRMLHQVAVTRISVLLDDYVRRQGLGQVVVAPSDVVLDAYTLLQPDIRVQPLPADWRVRAAEDFPPPLLVVEVLSPSTMRADRFVKRQRYLREGIECWLVDLEERSIERWTANDAGPDAARTLLRWHPATAREPLVVDVAALMRELLEG